MRKRTAFVRLSATLLCVAGLSPSPRAQLLGPPAWLVKLDPLLQQRASLVTGQSRVIVRASGAGSLAAAIALIRHAGGSLGLALPIVDGQVATLPNASLPLIAMSPLVQHLSLDRAIAGALERTGATVGAAAVRETLGYDGSGIGVAVIDSGVTPSHDDLPVNDRVDRFVDFVNGHPVPYDDYGHGTHVAGIIAGNGFDSGGARSGIAPGAHLVALKTLDGSGRGRISDVIAALGYAVVSKDALNIRVVNLSVSTGVYESANVDPLTLAALAAVRSGIVVVAAAGNNGRSPQGRTQYGGITAPGNAPWVLTVGASSHSGTIARDDDTIAAFSSRGPSAVDAHAKPDLVAPGVGIESLSDPGSAFYRTKAPYLLNGTVPTSYLPYLSLSGTSMATPVVSGTVALMLQANPALTPNQVKAILQYTAETYAGWDALSQGAGFLNAKGAVDLARFLASPSDGAYPSSSDWSGRILWGNRLFQGGQLSADANAWSTTVAWGSTFAASGHAIEFGVICATANCDGGGGQWTPWGAATADSQNVVWGTTCGGADCRGRWQASAASDGDTVVWGSSGEDTVVWGSSCDDPSCRPVIWGGR